jgi:oligoribonuclease (3'-5' exoribonuclease)
MGEVLREAKEQYLKIRDNATIKELDLAGSLIYELNIDKYGKHNTYDRVIDSMFTAKERQEQNIDFINYFIEDDETTIDLYESQKFEMFNYTNFSKYFTIYELGDYMEENEIDIYTALEELVQKAIFNVIEEVK